MGTKYASYVLCDSLCEAERLVSERNLGEEIVSGLSEVTLIPDYRDLNNYEFLCNLPEILHTASFISYMALRSQKTTIDDVLGDEGILHELTHIAAKAIPVDENSLSSVRMKLEKLQRCAIGLFYQPL